MSRAMTNIGLVALLSVGTVALVQVVVSAPAFNADLRRGNVFGDATLLLGRDMYDRPAYLYQQAASFVRADLVPDIDPEAEQMIASVEETEERAMQAVALVRESLAMDPGNAGAWTVLAWAQLLTGDIAEARAALRTSWTLAPHSLALAEERIGLAFTIFDPALQLAEAPIPEPTQAERAAMVRDSQTLWQQRRNLHRVFREEALERGLPVFDPPSGG